LSVFDSSHMLAFHAGSPFVPKSAGPPRRPLRGDRYRPPSKPCRIPFQPSAIAPLHRQRDPEC
jgi:hypothetical protein